MFQNILAISVCSLVVFVHGISGTKHADPEAYYWRDYAGYIPGDAISGGSENNAITYLGLTTFRNLYVPAKIIASEGKAIFEWGDKTYTSTENIKILCTDQIERFYWLRTTYKNFDKIDDKLFVLAARERATDRLYFGRIQYQGDVVVGKLLVGKYIEVYGEHNGEVARSGSDAFEVLFYKPPGTIGGGKNQLSACYCKKKNVALNFFTC